MTTQVFFVVSQARNVLTVPMAALQQGQQIARELAAKQQKDGTDRRLRLHPARRAQRRDRAAAAAHAALVAGGPASGGSVPRRRAAGDAGAAVPRRRNGGPPGGGFGGGASGGGGGFNPQNMTPEQREEMIAPLPRAAVVAAALAVAASAAARRRMAAAAAAMRQAQRRNGTVMVKLADGTLEPRRVVIGVTDRVHGEVLEGLKEGEEVVVGKHEAEAAAATDHQPAPEPELRSAPRRWRLPGRRLRRRPF